MITGSKGLIRDINTNLVLETIINHNANSRASIAKYLGLTKATVSTIVQELINRKLVVEIGSDDTSLGRKPILLSLQKKAGYAISIDLGVDTISALISDLAGEDSCIKRIRTPKKNTDLADALIRLIESMQRPKDTPYGLVGIALGIHGIVTNNQVFFASYYNLAGFDLAGTLEQHFNTPVYLENDANLSVISEMTLQYDYDNIASLNVHSGIGLGIIINRRLYTGYNGHAGEFGHTIIEVDGRPCPCGNKGCFEQYASERSLLNEFAKRKGLADIGLDQFKKGFAENDPDAHEIMDLFVKYMSVGINNIVNTYNPEIVVINSSFADLFPQVITRIEEALTGKMNNCIKIVPSALSDSSILLGGICVVVKSFLGVNDLNTNTYRDAHS